MSSSFSILVNGTCYSFFNPSRGLSHGFPLSPYFFLLIVEGISRLIIKYRQSRLIQGISMAQNIHITHLLFVDDDK
jgi:hypothetical protein